MLSAALAYLAFALLALVGPGLALLRLARVKLDAALILPLGLAVAAGAYWLSLVLHLPWLFPAIVFGLDLSLVVSPRPWPRAEGPPLRGAVPPFLALVLFFALTEYPLNRPGPRGEFVFDNVVPEDTTFHVALAWELTVGYPPQVPGLSGEPMGYHVGLPLVRAAATRWAGVHPYDQMSRFEITLVALGLILVLRSAAQRLGAGPAAAAIVPWTLLATDFSFLFGWDPQAEMWLNLTDANLLFSLAHANSSVAAILIAVAALVALDRHAAGEGRGWLALAVVLSLALPHFKAFVSAQYLFGLGVAALLARRFTEPVLLALPALAGLGAVVLGRASANMEVLVDPLTIVQKLRHGLALGPAHGASLALWTVAWIVTSLGLRVLGVPSAVRALRSASLCAVALAAMALVGWPVGLLFRVTPLEFPGRPPYNEAWYFIEQSAPFLWLFTAVSLSRLRLAGPRALLAAAACVAVSLPSTLQFVSAKRRTPAVTAPRAIVEAMSALEKVSRPGDVVLQKPEPKRYPPPPMVLIGRRVPYTRFIPYLYQVAPPTELRKRIELVRAFFKTTDAREAMEVARVLGARYVCLYGGDALNFDPEGVLSPIYDEPNARVYEIMTPGTAVTPPASR